MGASGTIIVGAGATLSTSAGVTGLQNGLVLNGGTVSSRGLVHSNYRNLLLESNISAGGGATSTISSEISLAGNREIAVVVDSTLNITGGIANDGFFGGSQGITKTGTGTLKLTAANTYTGNTTVSEGQLILGNGTNNTTLSDSADLSIASGATLQLDYSAGNTDTIDELWLGGVQQSPGIYGAGTYSGVTITGSGTLTVLNGPPADPFANWMSTNYPAIVSPDNQPGADPDNDGIANLVEYLLQGGNPSVNTTNSLPSVNTSGANFVFTYFRRAAATGTTQTFEYSTDLDGWTSVAIPGGSGVTVSDQGGGIDKVEISVAKDTNSSLFGRLKVVK
jgi:autotransporter-associated beta strand protein